MKDTPVTNSTPEGPGRTRYIGAAKTMIRAHWLELVVGALAAAIIVIALRGLPERQVAVAVSSGSSTSLSTTASSLGSTDLFWVDSVVINGKWLNIPREPSLRRYHVNKGDVVVFNGWSIDPTLKKPARGIEALVDAKDAFVGPVGNPRPDVATYFHLTDADNSGFKLSMPTDALSIGPHHVTFRSIASDGVGYYTTRLELTLTVTASERQAQKLPGQRG